MSLTHFLTKPQLNQHPLAAAKFRLQLEIPTTPGQTAPGPLRRKKKTFSKPQPGLFRPDPPSEDPSLSLKWNSTRYRPTGHPRGMRPFQY